MNYTSSLDAFDLFASCYVYGCIAYVSVLFVLHVYCSLSSESRVVKVTEPDFYTQVKDLLNPATEPIFAPDILQPQLNFNSMTIRELRAHIKENQLQKQIHDSIGKTVSNANKHELIRALI